MSICSDLPAASGDERGLSACDEIMLFGVRVKVDPMRKCVSMNNLNEYEPASSGFNSSGDELQKVAAAGGGGGGAIGYASADDVVPFPSSGSRGRKRVLGVPWTEEEHKLFLIGLQKVGKGDWRGISRNYVKTRTPTQVASHAQKYFIRQSNLKRRRRRSSVFDVTTDSISPMPTEQQGDQQDSPAQPVPQPTIISRPRPPIANRFPVLPFPVPASHIQLSMQHGNIVKNAALGESGRANYSPAMFVSPSPILPTCTHSSTVDLTVNQPIPPEPPSPLSLMLSLSSGQDQTFTRDSSCPVISGLKNGDNNTIRVA